MVQLGASLGVLLDKVRIPDRFFGELFIAFRAPDGAVYVPIMVSKFRLTPEATLATFARKRACSSMYIFAMLPERKLLDPWDMNDI